MKLKIYLKKNNIKQTDFVARLPIKDAQLSQIINGKATPSLGLALRIEELTWGAVTPKDYDLSI